MTFRVWHQSSTPLDDQTYRDLIVEHARTIEPSFELDLHGVVYPVGQDHEVCREIRNLPYGQMLTDLQCAHNAIQAEREGYDAFVYTCYNDPGLYEARSMVNIPIVGLCETSVFAARDRGVRAGIVGVSEGQTRRVGATLERLHLTDHVVDVVSMTKPWIGAFQGFTGGSADGGASAIESFLDAARQTIALGAGIVIPGEGALNILLARRGITEVDGVPILDSWAAVLRRAKALIEAPADLPSPRPDRSPISGEVADALGTCTADVLVFGWRGRAVVAPEEIGTHA